jgi:hypothetical protein
MKFIKFDHFIVTTFDELLGGLATTQLGGKESPSFPHFKS